MLHDYHQFAGGVRGQAKTAAAPRGESHETRGSTSVQAVRVEEERDETDEVADAAKETDSIVTAAVEKNKVKRMSYFI